MGHKFFIRDTLVTEEEFLTAIFSIFKYQNKFVASYVTNPDGSKNFHIINKERDFSEKCNPQFMPELIASVSRGAFLKAKYKRPDFINFRSCEPCSQDSYLALLKQVLERNDATIGFGFSLRSGFYTYARTTYDPMFHIQGSKHGNITSVEFLEFLVMFGIHPDNDQLQQIKQACSTSNLLKHENHLKQEGSSLSKKDLSGIPKATAGDERTSEYTKILEADQKDWYLTSWVRECEPAKEVLFSREKHWYQNGKIHREDGPAVEFTNIKSNQQVNQVNLSEVKEEVMSRQKKIANEIIKRSIVSEVVHAGQSAVLELLTFFGVRKTSKLYKFFASDFSNGILKTAVGLFLMYCPFTQDEKYQAFAEELLAQAGVSTIKEAIHAILSLLAPQAQKFVELITNLKSADPVRIAESEAKPVRVSEAAHEPEELEVTVEHAAMA